MRFLVLLRDVATAPEAEVPVLVVVVDDPGQAGTVEVATQAARGRVVRVVGAAAKTAFRRVAPVAGAFPLQNIARQVEDSTIRRVRRLTGGEACYVQRGALGLLDAGPSLPVRAVARLGVEGIPIYR